MRYEKCSIKVQFRNMFGAEVLEDLEDNLLV